jgi:hypothetical protein
VNGGQEARLNGGGGLPYWIETHFLPASESRREANWSADAPQRWFVFALGRDAGIRDRVEEQFTAEETA